MNHYSASTNVGLTVSDYVVGGNNLQVAGRSHITKDIVLYRSDTYGHNCRYREQVVMASALIPESRTLLSDEEKRKVYAAFQAKVKRTVYIKSLSPQATKAVIKSALGQMGHVKNVDFLPNEVLPFGSLAQAALVEMESEKEANAVITTLNDFPFMISGTPRPVRAKAAWPKLFLSRPPPPGKKLIEFRWVNPFDPDANNIKKLAIMAKRHQFERMALIKAQLRMEEKLAEQEQEVLTANHKKYEIMDKPMRDGILPKLASYYHITLADEY